MMSGATPPPLLGSRRTHLVAVALLYVLNVWLYVRGGAWLAGSEGVRSSSSSSSLSSSSSSSSCAQASVGAPRYARAGRLAVVRPYIPRHVDAMLADMATWSTLYAPCARFAPATAAEDTAADDDNDADSARVAIDLVFYFSYDHTAPVHASTTRSLLATVERAPWRRCFADVVVLSAALDEASDAYTRARFSGPPTQFYRLWNNAEFTERHYAYFLYMEPDLTPVRARWLDRLVDECLFDADDFWMKGSLYTGSKFVGDLVAPIADAVALDDDERARVRARHGVRKQVETFMFHINGNAIYNAADPHFRFFVRSVEEAQGSSNTFDVSLFVHRYKRYRLAQQHTHRFRYTRFVQNFGVAGYSRARLARDEPATFLVHKKLNCSDCEPIVE